MSKDQTPSPPNPGSLPERIGKYEILSSLGKGAMGVVYHARDPLLDRDVALKLMLPQTADDPEQRARFEREARAIAKIVHPNVVTVFDLGYHSDGSPYIAMELLQGEDLLQRQRHGAPMSLDRKITTILQVLDGLAQAHKAGIVHRDIKPANTFLTADGTAKIMDFGVARFTGASMTETGIVVGTANYMSPEQVKGEKVDGRSDLFSVGCMLAELVTGHRPFQADSLLTTLYRISHNEPDLDLPPSRERDALLSILHRALAKDPEARFQTAGQFAEALRQFLKTIAPEEQATPVRPASAPSSAALPREPTIELDRRTPAPIAPPPEHEIPKPPMDAAPLFQLMREIVVKAKSGHIHFAQGKQRRSLRVLRGEIVQGISDVDGEHLGDVLVRYGRLPQADLDRATAIVLRDRKRLGTVLPELGIMEKAALESAVALQVREILSNVVGGSGSSYIFEERDEGSLSEQDLTARIPVGEMILETARRIQEPESMRKVLGDMGRTLALSNSPLLRSQKITLTPTDGFVMSRIDGTLSAREVVSLIPLPPEDTERSLFSLLCTGTVEYVSPTASRARHTEPPRGQTPSVGFPIAPPSPQRGPQVPPPPSASATPPPPSSPAPPPRSAAPPPPLSRPPAAYSAAEKEKTAQSLATQRAQIVDAYEGRNRNHFEVLGATRQATAADLKEKYLHLAKAFHPDTQLDPTLDDLKEKRNAVFIRLVDAYETLRDHAGRAKYESDLDARAPRAPSPPPAPQPPAAPDPEKEAREATEAFQLAEKLLKEGSTWDAIQTLEGLAAKSKGTLRLRAKVLLAVAYLKNPKWVRKAEETLLKVVEENPRHVDAYVALGRLYRDSELKGRAASMFRKALEVQPGHEEAQRELASMEEPHHGKILDKLFRKT